MLGLDYRLGRIWLTVGLLRLALGTESYFDEQERYELLGSRTFGSLALRTKSLSTSAI